MLHHFRHRAQKLHLDDTSSTAANLFHQDLIRVAPARFQLSPAYVLLIMLPYMTTTVLKMPQDVSPFHW